ncbi:MAG: Crp/Fnr family transcriptional regulator [Pseudomonadota bacterium]
MNAKLPADTARAANAFLADLPDGAYAVLAPALVEVSVGAGDVLYEAGRAIDFLYFPHDCLVCVLAVAEGRMTLEVGLVGNEGVLGALQAQGEGSMALRAIVQRAGRASRIGRPQFLRALAREGALQQALQRYTARLLAQAIQTALCSRFHVLEARLARSLLITRERLQSDHFHLTHEFLAHALGVRRVGVTKAASALQQQGLIDYSRGNIDILDADGLAAASCTCYTHTKPGLA